MTVHLNTPIVHLNNQADLESAIHALVEQDRRLKPILKHSGMPSLRRRDPGYAGLAAIVCGQQVSTASAAAIWGRVSAAFDPFHHDAVRRARTDRLGRLGLSAAKIKTLKNLARELSAERLNLETLANEDADRAHATLTALHGIGPWTADVYLLFCLGHGDAWPAGDLAVQEAVKIGLGLMAWLLPAERPLGHVNLGVDTLAYAAAAVLLGFQLVFFGVAAKVFAITEGLLPEDPGFDNWFRYITLETGLVVGVFLLICGLGIAVSSVIGWSHAGYGALPPVQMMRRTLPAMLCLMLGTEVCFASFFLSLLGLKRR